MREQEMRIRVFRFFKARVRNLIMPATVGLGMAVTGGCGAPFRPDSGALDTRALAEVRIDTLTSEARTGIDGGKDVP